MGDKIKIDLSSMFGEDFATQIATPKKTTTKKNGEIKIDLNDLFGVDFKKPKYIDNVEDQEYDHISQDDFLDISGKGFGLFTEGREEIMQAKLYETYNPNNNEDGIQFEQYGSGNNIRVILPNGDEEEIELSGDDGAEAKENYIKFFKVYEIS